MKPKNFDIANPDWKQEIPVPVFEEKPEYLDLYWKAWDLARAHVKDIPGMPQNPYMDEAFIETDIWIWDTCFMMFFCKYAANVFPGIETLNNFYQPLYEGRELPELVVPANFPEWTGLKEGDRTRIVIHIPDNPPLFAWAEYNYALLTGDLEHIRTLLMEKQYLQKHFAWLESLTAPILLQGSCRNVTCLIKREDGYFWEGGRSGMDNTPRGRSGEKAGAVHRPNHPKMLWVDAISQQALSALFISKCAKLIGEDALADTWMRKYEEFKAKINRLYWDSKDSMYYDIHEDTHEFMKCLTPASYWPLLACIPDADQVNGMLRYLRDPAKLGGKVPWTTVSRDDPDFNPENGQYWRGSLWLPTAYMGIKGLENYGHYDLANSCARRIIDHMSRTYRDFSPHTIWECYSPNKAEPACPPEGKGLVRPDFCGWSALGPISLFLENVIGVSGVNAFTGTVEWHLPPEIRGKIGIRNLSFGDTVTDLLYENGRCSIRSNRPYTLKINGNAHSIPAGDSVLEIS